MDALNDAVNFRLGNTGGAATSMLKKHHVYAAFVRIQIDCDFERSALSALELEALKFLRVHREDAGGRSGNGRPLNQKEDGSSHGPPSRNKRGNLRGRHLENDFVKT